MHSRNPRDLDSPVTFNDAEKYLHAQAAGRHSAHGIGRRWRSELQRHPYCDEALFQHIRQHFQNGQGRQLHSRACADHNLQSAVCCEIHAYGQCSTSQHQTRKHPCQRKLQRLDR